jgi:hypothetical protein
MICEELKKRNLNFQCLAPTNKAALNIKGSTIHRFLKMDEEGNISKKVLEGIKKRYKYMIIDEISMIGKDIWKRLVLLKQAFKLTNNKKIQSGGNPLKDLIAPLGTNAFIATGLLIILEKLFTSSMNEVKKNKNNLIGGKINKNYEKLFNLIAPLTFNTFAKKSFLDNLTKNKILNK